MKALVLPNGSIAPWFGTLPSSHDGWFVDIVEDEVPAITAVQVVVQGALVADYTDGVPTQVRQTWTIRAKTADELRRTWTCLDFIARFTPDERAAVRTYAPDLMEMLLAAHEIESDNPLTLYGLDALVASGLITEARKEQLLA